MRLGQHFLQNQAVLKKIASALDAQPNETIIEIGAGHGELTDVLNNELRIKNYATKIITIEKDDGLATELLKKFSEEKNIEIIHGDALTVIPSLIHNSLFILQNYTLVGNIPYYLTGYLLRIISELEEKPTRCVFTIQKEVALRLAAAPPKMNKLAASIQFWADPTIISFVPKKDFHPAPEVDSAIINLETRNMKHGTGITKNYYHAVTILFRQPRKTILNNLVRIDKRGLNADQRRKFRGESLPTKEKIIKNLAKLGINPENRPQNLRIEDIIAIARMLSQKQ